jgi:NAD(P)-dependent dehydrogenase (short-subunit alcohol dehydrogenase family)
LDRAVQEIGKNVTAVKGDVSSAEDIDGLYATVKREKGHVDVVVANAGIVEVTGLAHLTDAHYDKIFDINVRGVIYTVRKLSKKAIQFWTDLGKCSAN